MTTEVAQDFYSDEDPDLLKNKKKKKTTDNLVGNIDQDGTQVGAAGESRPGQTNIQQYIDQNKPETAEMAAGAGERLGQAQSAFESQLGDVSGQFKDRVQKGGVSYDQGISKQFTENPFEASQDKRALEQLTQMRDASYKGPQQFSQAQDIYKPLLGQQQKLISQANLIKTQPNLTSNRLTAGQQALNRTLVTSTPGAFGQLQSASEKALESSRGFDRERDVLNELARQRQKETQETTKRIGQDLGTARTNLRDTIRNRVSESITKGLASQKEFGEAMGREDFRALDEGETAAIARSGLTPEQFIRLRESEQFIENPYQDINYRSVNIMPNYVNNNNESGRSGWELRGNIPYLDGKPDLSGVPEHLKTRVLEAIQNQAAQQQRVDVGGREFDPSSMFTLNRPETIYRDSTVTTPEEYQNIQAFRDLQQLESPIDFELEDEESLYGVTPQVSGDETIDEILESIAGESDVYRGQAREKFRSQNPFFSRYHTTRTKSRGPKNKKKKTSAGGGGTGNPIKGPGKKVTASI